MTTTMTPTANVIRVIAGAAIKLTRHNETSASFHTAGADLNNVRKTLDAMDGVKYSHIGETLTLTFNCEKACKRFVRTLSTFTKFKTLSDNRIG